MPKKNHSGTAGRWTTAADAAERPAETVAETVPTRHETPDVADVEALLDMAGGEDK